MAYSHLYPSCPASTPGLRLSSLILLPDDADGINCIAMVMADVHSSASFTSSYTHILSFSLLASTYLLCTYFDPLIVLLLHAQGSFWKFKYPFNLMPFMFFFKDFTFVFHSTVFWLLTPLSFFTLLTPWMGCPPPWAPLERWTHIGLPGEVVKSDYPSFWSSFLYSSQTTQQPHKAAQVLLSKLQNNVEANPFKAAYALLIFFTEMSVVHFL